jgi:DDE superfamily endonuclease
LAEVRLTLQQGRHLPRFDELRAPHGLAGSGAHQASQKAGVRPFDAPSGGGGDYPQAEKKIRVVLDNLSTHTAAAFYESFTPEQARRLARRIEFCYTPVHGSWLNMVEIELSVLVRQCLKRRLPDMGTLEREVEAWQTKRTRSGASVDWRFTTEDARIKLRSLYPS